MAVCGRVWKKCAKKFGGSKKSPYLCRESKTKDMRQYKTQLETLTFTKGDAVATIVTNGDVTRTYTAQETLLHRSLSSAVAHLECKGYRINMQHEVTSNSHRHD